jgi:hypothetical protein
MKGGSAHETDASSEQPKMTAGVDIADKYSYLSASSTNTAARSSRRVCSAHNPRCHQATLRLRAASYAHSAIEAGTHSPWVSRVLMGCGHEVMVANARKLRLIYARASEKPTRSMPRIWLAWCEWTRSSPMSQPLLWRLTTEAGGPPS